MKKVAICFLICLLCLVCGSSLADVALDKSNFPDDGFLDYLVSNGFDSDGDQILSDKELSEVTTIECTSCSIESLKGIEYFILI